MFPEKINTVPAEANHIDPVAQENAHRLHGQILTERDHHLADPTMAIRTAVADLGADRHHGARKQGDALRLLETFAIETLEQTLIEAGHDLRPEEKTCLVTICSEESQREIQEI